MQPARVVGDDIAADAEEVPGGGGDRNAEGHEGTRFPPASVEQAQR